jgi:hypothetical protein
MILRLRRTSVAPAYQDWTHYTVIEDGDEVGRIYEDRAAPAEQRWFWSVTVDVNQVHGILTSGRTGTFEEAKAAFRTSWEKVSKIRQTATGSL